MIAARRIEAQAGKSMGSGNGARRGLRRGGAAESASRRVSVTAGALLRRRELFEFETLSRRGESDSRLPSYQDGVLPLNYPGTTTTLRLRRSFEVQAVVKSPTAYPSETHAQLERRRATRAILSRYGIIL